MHRIFRVKAYEMEHGPHFNEEHARKAVSNKSYCYTCNSRSLIITKGS